jgi:saccharopine dehydrogenase-like NADP-dependent oxidoreductase
VVIREALSDPEMVELEEIGTLESFNTDGLRTLIRTMDIPDMIEKTLRYPGTIEYLRVLRKGGFFSYDPVDINGKKVSPIDLTAKLLFPQWKLLDGERDLTIMRIIMEGTLEDGTTYAVQYNLLDRYDESNQILSMARTTGYTCSAVVRLILGGHVQRIGILPPEWVGEDESNFDFVINYLEERKVIYKKIII